MIKFKKIKVITYIVAVVTILLKCFKMGQEKEKAKNNKQILENVKKVQNAINNLDDNERERLHKKYNRK